MAKTAIGLSRHPSSRWAERTMTSAPWTYLGVFRLDV